MGAKFSAFEVEGICGAMDKRINCGVKTVFNNTSKKQSAQTLGGLTRGNIETNGDIAGIGTLLAFVIPTGISLVIGLVMLIDMWNHRSGSNHHGRYNKEVQTEQREHTKYEKFYEGIESILLATADSQIILGIALGINFLVVGKCTFIMYHFQMGLSILEIACVNAVLAFTLLRHYWKAPLAAIIRLGGLITVLYFLGFALNILKVRSYAAERLPPKDRLDSLILLKAACFLDKDFKAIVFNKLTETDYQTVGRLVYKGRLSPEWVLWCLLTVLTCVVFFFRTAISVASSSAFKGSTWQWVGPFRRSEFRGWVRLLYSSVTWILCFSITVHQANYAFKLRSWAHSSGWLKGKYDFIANEEKNVYGFGQLAALFAMAGLLICSLDQMKFRFSECWAWVF